MQTDSFDHGDSHQTTDHAKIAAIDVAVKRRKSLKLLEKTLQSLDYDSDSDEDTEMGMEKTPLESYSSHKYDDNDKKMPAAYGSLDSSYNNVTKKKTIIQTGDSSTEKMYPDDYSTSETTSLLTPLLPVDTPIDNNVSSNKIEAPFRSLKKSDDQPIDTKKDDHTRIEVDERKKSFSDGAMNGAVKPPHEIKSEKDDEKVSSVYQPAEVSSFVTDCEKKPDFIEKENHNRMNENSHLPKNVTNFEKESVQNEGSGETTPLLDQNSDTSELLQPSIFTMHNNT